MSKRRFYISTESIKENIVFIKQPEYHHMIDVLRLDNGDMVEVFDGKGNEYDCEIKSIDRDLKLVELLLKKTRKESISKPLILVQSLIKSNNMDVIIQKATELGVTHIYPISTENSIIKLDKKEEISKIKKWQRISEEASKQCGRSWIPHIDKIWTISEIVDSLEWVETKIICVPREAAKLLKSIPDKDISSIAVMVGPEGDFTNKETELVCDRGWVPVHLGKTILRAETAAISVLAVVSYKFGYWG